jgi:hypothetical protein
MRRGQESMMPPFHSDADTVGGSWSSYQTLAFRERCACCGKKTFLGWWMVNEERTRFRDGTEAVH